MAGESARGSTAVRLGKMASAEAREEMGAEELGRAVRLGCLSPFSLFI